MASFGYVFLSILLDSNYYKSRGTSEFTKDILVSCAIFCFLLLSCYWSYILFKIIR